jgi:hypothetical protein
MKRISQNLELFLKLIAYVGPMQKSDIEKLMSMLGKPSSAHFFRQAVENKLVDAQWSREKGVNQKIYSLNYKSRQALSRSGVKMDWSKNTSSRRHDVLLRKSVIDWLFQEKIRFNSFYELTTFLNFPVRYSHDRQVADVIFIKPYGKNRGKYYYFEFDAGTETQGRLAKKLRGYEGQNTDRRTELVFVFDRKKRATNFITKLQGTMQGWRLSVRNKSLSVYYLDGNGIVRLDTDAEY